MIFKRIELLKFRKFKGPIIDVRSPNEYYKGHLPNSFNIPLFNNEEREEVGIIYKKFGREKAVYKGLQFLENKIDKLIYDITSMDKYIQNIENKNLNDNKIFKIYCARGGMRSQSIYWLINKLNYSAITLKGGYKSYRRWTLNQFINKKNIIILGGKTGTGKTKLLNMLADNNMQIIDLEYLANHRGSTFGGLGLGEQPSNEQFENLIAEKINSYNPNKKIYIEAESSNIGKCRIPHELHNQMKSSPRIEIIKSESLRLKELINTYSIFSKEDLKEAVLRIKKRLGPQRTKTAIESIEKEDWVNVCKSVLDYYDKCYDYEKSTIKNTKIVDLSNIKNEKNIINIIKQASKG